MDEYALPSQIDFSILINRWRELGLWENDMFLGMQGMNIGITDETLTFWEQDLHREFMETERPPIPTAMTLSGFSQMWIFAAYETMRVWRNRVFQYRKWFQSGSLAQVIPNLTVKENEVHLPKQIKKAQLERYCGDEPYRKKVNDDWALFEPTYRRVELLRMNLAKHAAPGKDNMLARAPGYARINMVCGSLDYQVVDKDGRYTYLSRRDVADALRTVFASKPCTG